MTFRGRNGGSTLNPGFFAGDNSGRGGIKGAIVLGGASSTSPNDVFGCFVACEDSTATRGGDIQIAAGGGFADSTDGGSVSISAGSGAFASGNGGGGSVNIGGGESGPDGGTGGGVSITAGGSEGGNGASVNLTGGAASDSLGSDDGGEVRLRGGQAFGTGLGGPITIEAGNSSSDTGGTVTIDGGDGLLQGGDVVITTGGGSGAAPDGEISLNGSLKAKQTRGDGLRFERVTNLPATPAGSNISVSFSSPTLLNNQPRCVQITGQIAAGITSFNITNIATTSITFVADQNVVSGDVIYLLVIP